MTDKDSPFNLFGEEAGKPSHPPRRPPPPPPEGPVPSDEEVEKMLNRMSQLHEEIRTTIEEGVRGGAVSLEQIMIYLSDRQNFTEDQWHFVQKERDQMIGKLWSDLGKEYQQASKEKIKRKKGKRLKGKGLGSKRKWLEM